MLPLGHPVSQLGVSFHEKQLKIVAPRCEICSVKFTKYRLAAGAGLRPDPLGELNRSPDPLAVIRGLLLRGGEGEGLGGEKERKGEWEGREREEREWEGQN